MLIKQKYVILFKSYVVTKKRFGGYTESVKALRFATARLLY